MPQTTQTIEEYIVEAHKLIEEADAILIFAGAGMGVDSGLPDFRGNTGFWQAYPIAKQRGLSFEGLANPDWFWKEPSLAWAFYGHRLNLYRQTIPHKGFKILLNICKAKNNDYFIVTSNVDGQFQKAGFDPDKIYEIHGSIHHLQCAGTKDHGIWNAMYEHVLVDMESFKALEPYPKCPECGKIARPNIMMFGDLDFLGSRSDAQMKRFGRWKLDKKEDQGKIAIIEIGAGTSIPSIRRMSESAAKQFHIPLIRINPRESQGLLGTIKLPLGAKDALEKLLSYGDEEEFEESELSYDERFYIWQMEDIIEPAIQFLKILFQSDTKVMDIFGEKNKVVIVTDYTEDEINSLLHETVIPFCSSNMQKLFAFSELKEILVIKN